MSREDRGSPGVESLLNCYFTLSFLQLGVRTYSISKLTRKQSKTIYLVRDRPVSSYKHSHAIMSPYAEMVKLLYIASGAQGLNGVVM